MATWEDLCEEADHAALVLYRAARGAAPSEALTWRSSISRSYYAVYSQAAAVLTRAGVSFRRDREGPEHDEPLQRHLRAWPRGLQPHERRHLKALVKRLYHWRLASDYHPSVSIGEPEARGARQDAFEALRLLRRTT